MEIREKHLLPPSSNTGVESTTDISLRPCVDWLQVTFFGEVFPEDVIEYLGLSESDFTVLKGGKFGYKNALGFLGSSTLCIHYDGNEGMGVHLEMTGKGCRQFEANSEINWYELFYRLRIDYEGKFTRLDLALDDFKGYFTIPNLIKRLRRDTVTSRFRKVKHIENITVNGGERFGHTIYFGSSASDIQIRMYEKNVESKTEDEIWNRTELQLRDGRAHNTAFLIANDVMPVGDIISGILRNYIQFRDKSKTDKLKRRWKVSKFWNDFLDNAKALSISERLPETSIERKHRWIDKQVSKSFFMIYECLRTEEEKNEFINDVIDSGASDLNKADLDIMNRFKNKELSYQELKKALHDEYMKDLGKKNS